MAPVEMIPRRTIEAAKCARWGVALAWLLAAVPTAPLPGAGSAPERAASRQGSTRNGGAFAPHVRSGVHILSGPIHATAPLPIIVVLRGGGGPSSEEDDLRDGMVLEPLPGQDFEEEGSEGDSGDSPDAPARKTGRIEQAMRASMAKQLALIVRERDQRVRRETEGHMRDLDFEACARVQRTLHAQVNFSVDVGGRAGLLAGL